MTQEVLKLALEFIENSECGTADLEARIKEALAQTQEPVVKLKTSNMLLRCHRCGSSDKLNIQIEYTTPPQRTWAGLTDEEVRNLWSWSATSEAEKTANTQQHAFARAIEAKLKELNT